METIEDNKLPTVTDNEATSPKDVLNRVFSLIDNV